MEVLKTERLPTFDELVEIFKDQRELLRLQSSLLTVLKYPTTEEVNKLLWRTLGILELELRNNGEIIGKI